MKERPRNEAQMTYRIRICLLAGLIAGWMAAVAAAQTPAAVQAPADSAKAAAPVTATPAMWKVKGAKGTVYLFGSIHVMKKGVEWETAKVREALGTSDTLYLEIAGLDDAAMQAAQPQIMALGVDQEHPLSTKISKDDLALLDGALKTMGMAGEQAFEPLKPWLASLTISMLPTVQAGYDPNSGIDKTLEAQVKDTKAVKGLETLDEQLHYVSDLPDALQTAMLHQTLADLPKAVTDTDTMVADWEKGDVEAIAKLNNEEMKTKYPELYERLLVKRNVRFADALAGILKDPTTGTVFVAVGAAHLAGPDSVIKMLETRGYKAERVE
jgi:uncharacterized protein YbaP (TraB family)